MVAISKEEEVQKISTSIFVTNFPDHAKAKDLWNVCKQYGQVVDAFIPDRKSKAGKRYGFVRFIRVYDVDRLVSNLCTLWMGSHHLHANVARFQRPPAVNSGGYTHQNGNYVPKKTEANSNNGHRTDKRSYVNVVNGDTKSTEACEPALLLDESCLNQLDYSLGLLGKVKEFSSFDNMRMVLGNEGFDDINLRYMGGMWIMIDFKTEDTKAKFQSCLGATSWFSLLIQASKEFVIDERITWVDIEGIPLKLWSESTFNRIAAKWGKMLYLEKLDEGCLYSKRLCILTTGKSNILETFKIIHKGKRFLVRAKETMGWIPDFDEQEEDNSESEDEQSVGFIKEDFDGSDVEKEGDNNVSMVPDSVKEDVNVQAEEKGNDFDVNNSLDPFELYSLLNKKRNVEEKMDKSNETVSIPFPPGFTPCDETEVECDKKSMGNNEGSGSDNEKGESVSIGSRKSNKIEIKRTGGSLLTVMEELIKVGKTMGYNMEGCLNPKAKKDWVKEICVSHKVNFLTLQETKMEDISLIDVKCCWGNYAFEYVYSPAVGNSGGILCVWEKSAFKKNNSTISDYFVMISGSWLCSGVNLLIISVYAPQEYAEKKMLWDYLVHVISKWDGEVIVMGYFNVVRFKNERFGSLFHAHGADAFNRFILQANLQEIPLGGCSFTWCHRSAKKMSKLDRFLMSEGLLGVNPNFSALTLDRYLSDHRPIMLRDSSHDYGPIPFRMYHYWFEIDGFEEMISKAWCECPIVEVNPMLYLMYKMKFLKKCIREWNGKRQSNKCKKRAFKKDLHDLEIVIDQGNATDDILYKRMEIIKDIQEAEKVDNLEAAQKAKIKWAIEGDENTKFYHGILNKKRNQLGIRGVLKDGMWIDNPAMVKKEFLEHFSTRFQQPRRIRPVINIDFPRTISELKKNELEGDISYQEIKRAVWDCGIDKSPGPDGVTFGFIRRYWSLIEKDVVAAVQHFFTSGNFPKGCNASFIALIPKIPDAKLVKDFRPISLIGSLYKIIAKILANRLVGVLGDLVSEVQSAFVADRQILDGPLILNEVLQWCKAKKKQTFIFKIDFEKAYDSVRWDFLGDVLNRFGFGAKWCGWIQECLRSSRGSVLVNGSTTEEFQFYKGLKQGDPLSPFLFILVMESLHLSFKRVEDAGMFNGIKINSSMTLSHMFYADDAIFMGQWSKRNIDTLMYMLKCFERASGLSINLSKSKLMGLAVSIEKVEEVTIDILVVAFLYSVFFSWRESRGMFVSDNSWDEGHYAIHGVDGRIGRAGNVGHTSIWCDIIKEMDRMPRSGIESEQWDHLLDSLEGVMLSPSEDRWSWDLNGSGEFSVASARRYIDNNRLPDISSKTRWIKEVPIKVNVHAWKVRINGLPTRWNISRRGIDIPSILCPLCETGVESSKHLFFNCSVVRDIFRRVCIWWDMSYMELDSFDE
ncbi:RNA-directed DNA polymerase, eukaryota [Tanacetum coccineum]